MTKPCPKHSPSSESSARVCRRTFLGGVAASTLASGVAGCGNSDYLGRHSKKQYAQSPFVAASDATAMPGPFPGRVIEVSHSGSVAAGVRSRDAVGGVAIWLWVIAGRVCTQRETVRRC